MFTSKINNMTGKLDWEILKEDYDYQQELARAGFADMLHDYERNKLYYAGLKKVIKKLKSENKKVNVLDIGTGTGLLSMMAVACGADSVTACEAFKPMIQVAKKCIEANGMKDRIKIIEKRSTDIQIGVDMVEQANVLVTEVFDTELIGEGAISTFTHALENLLTRDCYVVPDNAILYIQVVDSSCCQDWNWLNLDKYNIKVPETYVNLAGDAIWDIQLSQFDEFKPITEPIEAFKFSFSGKEPLVFENQSILQAISKKDCKANGIFMWWVCHMDYENEIVLSCAPKWAHHNPKDMQWRDHWMQAIYFPKNLVELKQGDVFFVKSNHDEYSLWFDILKNLPVHSFVNNINQASLTIENFLNQETPKDENENERTLGATIVSRNRLAQLNDKKINDTFVSLLEKYEDPNKSILIFNDDFSFLPLLAAKFSFKKIYTLETSQIRCRALDSFIKENNFANKITVINKSVHDLEKSDLNNIEFDIIFSECAFSLALLPWDNIYFYYGLAHLKSLLPVNDFKEKTVLPKSLKFYAIAVNLENLHKIRSPVGNCEGFNLDEFDKVILDASKESDGFLEPHPLWEYPCFSLSNPEEIFSLELNEKIDKGINKEIDIKVNTYGVLNGIALWHVINYDENFSINAGLLDENVSENNRKLNWNRNYKQAVHILDKTYKIDDTNIDKFFVKCILSFESAKGEFKLDFKINSD